MAMLSPATSTTLVLSCQALTASDKPKEGEDDVKSSCPLCPGIASNRRSANRRT